MQETSLKNKDNKNKSNIFSTTGSVPMAKYRYEMVLYHHQIVLHFIVYLHSLITLPMFFYSFKYCSILRRALSLALLIALRNFTQRRMAKNGQLIVLRHYMYATSTKVLILLSTLVFLIIHVVFIFYIFLFYV